MQYMIFSIIIPLVLAGIVITILFTIIRMILDLLHLNFYITRIIAFFVAYYYVGAYAFRFLEKNVTSDLNIYIRFIYMPIQVVLEYIK